MKKFLKNHLEKKTLLIATRHTFNSQFYKQTDDVAMGGTASSTTAEIHMQAHEETLINPPKGWEWFVNNVYSIPKRAHLENVFHHVKNFHQNINFTLEEKSNWELAFFNSFQPSDAWLYLLKTSENLKVFWCFQAV